MYYDIDFGTHSLYRSTIYQMVGCFALPHSNTIFFLTETSSGSAGILSLHFAKRKMGRMILNNALRAIVNAEKRGKATVELQPISTVMSSFLTIMKNRGKTLYILLLLDIDFVNQY